MNRRRTKKHTKKTRGGGFTFTGAAIAPGHLVVHQNLTPNGPDCLSQSRPGELSNLSIHQARAGLPGMSGGRYTIDLAQSIPSPLPGQAARIPCESSQHNPLNQRGGKRHRRTYHGGSGTTSVSIPTAGYGNQMTTSGGIPLLLQVPQNGRSCVTGGSRRHRRRSHRRTYRRRR